MSIISITSAVSSSGAPRNTALPTVTGTTTVGQTLTVSTGTWTPTPSQYLYQWYSKGTKISGATAASYTIQSTDYTTPTQSYIYATVSARNSVTTSAPVASAQVGPVLMPPLQIQYLVVGGGGGGGYDTNYGAGGGGAGGLLTGTFCYVRGTTFSVTVGDGGAGATNSQRAYNGGTSSIEGISGTPDKYAYGGGYGGGGLSVPCQGGSGGGARGGSVNSGGSGWSGQGYRGGSNTAVNRPGGGGGGASGVGGNGASKCAPGQVANKFAGNGAGGREIVIANSNATYAGGGGGSSGYYCATYISQGGFYSGYGGAGGGGQGGGMTSSCIGSSGADSYAGSGGGGGAGIGTPGTASNYKGGDGGSGTVILDYASPTDLFTTKTGSYSTYSYTTGGTTRQVISWGVGSGTAYMPQ